MSGDPQTWFSGTDDETIQQRVTLLEAWLNKVLRVCPGDREISMFLAADGSVPDEMLPVSRALPPRRAPGVCLSPNEVNFVLRSQSASPISTNKTMIQCIGWHVFSLRGKEFRCTATCAASIASFVRTRCRLKSLLGWAHAAAAWEPERPED